MLTTTLAPPSQHPIVLLLRDRKTLLATIRAADSTTAIVKPMVAAIVVAMAIVGAALGSYRGGEQILYAAIKLPVVLLGTAVLSAPVVTAIGAAHGRPARFAADLALVITALAFSAMLLCACTPLIMLGRALALPYHAMILATVAMFSAAGCAALYILVSTVARERVRGWRAQLIALWLVFAVTGGQLSWALRPYLVRPRSPTPVFVRELEGSLFDSVTTAFDSARGIYLPVSSRDEATSAKPGSCGGESP